MKDVRIDPEIFIIFSNLVTKVNRNLEQPNNFYTARCAVLRSLRQYMVLGATSCNKLGKFKDFCHIYEIQKEQ
jgi:hypothetical protein